MMFTKSIHNIKTILFIELLGGIGDVLISLPAIHALARSHPSAHLTVLTFLPGGELLNSDPLINRVICIRNGEARQAVDNLLAEESFDLIVSNVSYEGIADKVRDSAAAYSVTNLWRSPPNNQLVGDRFLSILLAEGLITPETAACNQPQLHITEQEKIVARQALGAIARPLVVLCPDAGMAIKKWSTENFITLGQTLQQHYRATILVPVGSDSEQAERIVEAIGGTAQIWPRGSLHHLATVLAEADLMIAADTGPARIAAALNVPTITLFGPSWHGRYGQPAPHINLQGFPTCPERNISNFTEQSCWYSGQCPFAWQTCLDDISPAQVLQAAAAFLNQPELLSNLSPERSPETATLLRSHDSDPSKSPLTRGTLSLADTSHPTPHTPHPTPHSPHPTPHTPHPTPPWPSVQNLLVMRLDNIGDVIMTSPALRALRENLPDARITLMASPGGSQAASLLPWIDDVLTYRVLWQDLGRLDFNPQREWDLIQDLSDRQLDAAIIFTSFSQSPHPAALICAIAGIPLRLGESTEQDLGTLTHAVPFAPIEIHQVERNLRLIESVGFTVSDRHLTLTTPNVEPHISGPYILLNPWTSCQARNYDPLKFAIAARQLSEHLGWPVAVTGMEKDRDRTQLIFKVLGDRALDLLGKTSLEELVALIANARLVLTNNTSTMHIADATQTPNIVMFAGTELESQWRPRHSPSRLLRRPTSCSPCYAFTCPYEMECLDIESEAVVQAALELLEIRSQESGVRSQESGVRSQE